MRPSGSTGRDQSLDVGDVLGGGSHEQDPLAGGASGVGVDQVGGAVGGDDGLASAWVPLDDEGLVDRRADELVLVGLEAGEDRGQALPSRRGEPAEYHLGCPHPMHECVAGVRVTGRS